MRRGPVRISRVIWRATAALEGPYFLAPGLWPIIDIESFQAVTGPKSDIWLVQLFGCLIYVPAVTVLHAAWSGERTAPVVLVGLGTALVLGIGDIVFVVRGSIGQVYLLDALVEMLISAGWFAAMMGPRRRSPAPQAPFPRIDVATGAASPSVGSTSASVVSRN